MGVQLTKINFRSLLLYIVHYIDDRGFDEDNGDDSLRTCSYMYAGYSDMFIYEALTVCIMLQRNLF